MWARGVGQSGATTRLFSPPFFRTSGQVVTQPSTVEPCSFFYLFGTPDRTGHRTTQAERRTKRTGRTYFSVRSVPRSVPRGRATRETRRLAAARRTGRERTAEPGPRRRPPRGGGGGARRARSRGPPTLFSWKGRAFPRTVQHWRNHAAAPYAILKYARIAPLYRTGAAPWHADEILVPARPQAGAPCSAPLNHRAPGIDRTSSVCMGTGTRAPAQLHCNEEDPRSLRRRPGPSARPRKRG